MGGSMRYFAEQRMAFIEQTLNMVGFINRSDLVKKFQISLPQAAIDFKNYQGLQRKRRYPKMVYNLSAKRYEVKR
jgi:hypothetical protein